MPLFLQLIIRLIYTSGVYIRLRLGDPAFNGENTVFYPLFFRVPEFLEQIFVSLGGSKKKKRASTVLLREVPHDILSNFFDGLNYGLSVGKPKNNSLLWKKNTKGVILKQKGTRMAVDEED